MQEVKDLASYYPRSDFLEGVGDVPGVNVPGVNVPGVNVPGVNIPGVNVRGI